MTAEQIGLLLQYPLVAVFIWYVLYTRKQDTAERQQWLSALEKIILAIADQDVKLDQILEHWRRKDVDNDRGDGTSEKS